MDVSARTLLDAAFAELLRVAAPGEAAGWADRLAGTPSGRLLLDRADAPGSRTPAGAADLVGLCRRCRTPVICLDPGSPDGRLVHANGDRSHAARPQECARILSHGLRCGSTQDSGRHIGGRWPGHGTWCCASTPHTPIDDCHAFEGPAAA